MICMRLHFVWGACGPTTTRHQNACAARMNFTPKITALDMHQTLAAASSIKLFGSSDDPVPL